MQWHRDWCSFHFFFRAAHQSQKNNNCSKYTMEFKILWFWVLHAPNPGLHSLLLTLIWKDISVCCNHWNKESFKAEAECLGPILFLISLTKASFSAWQPPKDLILAVNTNTWKNRLDLCLPLNSACLNHYCILLIKEYHYCDSISYLKDDLNIILVFQGPVGLGVSWFGLNGLTKSKSIICKIPINKGYITAGVEDGLRYHMMKVILF